MFLCNTSDYIFLGRFTPTTTVPAKTTAEVAVTRFFLANGEVQEISLNELECGAEYKVAIRAMNEIGRSFESANVTASTVGTGSLEHCISFSIMLWHVGSFRFGSC